MSPEDQKALIGNSFIVLSEIKMDALLLAFYRNCCYESRWLFVHIRDLIILSVNRPNMDTEFSARKWVVYKSDDFQLTNSHTESEPQFSDPGVTV